MATVSETHIFSFNFFLLSFFVNVGICGPSSSETRLVADFSAASATSVSLGIMAAQDANTSLDSLTRRVKVLSAVSVEE